MKKSSLWIALIALIVLAGGWFVFSDEPPVTGNVVQDIQPNVMDGETQRVVLSMKDLNYYPNEIRVKAGQPVSISLDESVTGCLRSFTIKDLGVSKSVRTSQETIDFTPTKKGTYRFACVMGMGYGKIIVE